MKHWKTSNSLPSRKRRFSHKLFVYLPAILLAMLLATYLDLYFVGKQLYEFPVRPFSDVFSINIAFTVIALPLFMWIFLCLVDKMSRWSRLVFTLFLSALVPFIEIMSEQLGFFQHGDQWNHIYSFIGYFLFLMLIWKMFKWRENGTRYTK
ncbi:CBO0543 family protein [Sporosarcina sp. NPDC096371]|uniref:CBO0543 family protein n=1 Tax=Sporosarcina sp. NPDC096371 TaxID=3364530 RepID=UPI00381959C7